MLRDYFARLLIVTRMGLLLNSMMVTLKDIRQRRLIKFLIIIAL